MAEEKRGILDRIENLDRRILYSIVILCIALPILRPLGLPIEINDSTESCYNFIQSLQEGSVVLVGFETGAAGWPELGPQLNVFMQHLFDKNAKIIIVSGNVDGAMLAEQYSLPTLVKPGKEYGVDWVNLGYIAGGETGIAAFASDIRSLVPKDYFGAPLDEIPMMRDINSAADFDLAICCSWGTPGLGEYLRQYYTNYGVPVIIGAQVVSVPGTVPYYQSGQIVGYTSGLRGAGEYEILIKRPGYAVSSLDAASVYHVVVFLFIVVGNVAFIAKKMVSKEEVM
jgi:hypothetical protein